MDPVLLVQMTLPRCLRAFGASQGSVSELFCCGNGSVPAVCLSIVVPSPRLLYNRSFQGELKSGGVSLPAFFSSSFSSFPFFYIADLLLESLHFQINFRTSLYISMVKKRASRV